VAAVTVLDAEEVERFVTDGFVHLPGAFRCDVAAECVDVLWTASGVDRDAPSTWTAPVVRVDGSGAPPLVEAINTPRLVGALDDLLGPGRWQRRTGYGTFPIRFPSEEDPGDAGWHVDGSYVAGTAPPPWNLHLNLWSRARALLLLMLFTDVGPDDAPTRIRVGSHLDVAPVLARHGVGGVPFADVTNVWDAGSDRPVALATGTAGDVYLCHPFLVHSATWPHRGRGPRFLGQPAILHASTRDRFDYHHDDLSATERAVRSALDRARIAVPAAPN
jgi:hypothetical protein